jgi:hypothetical protein
MTVVKDVEDNYVVGKDSRGHELTHYVLAERLVQLEVSAIKSDLNQGDYGTLSSILEDGFRGYHKMSSGELWAEWKDAEDKWYSLYDDDELEWMVCDQDPLSRPIKTPYTAGEGI